MATADACGFFVFALPLSPGAPNTKRRKSGIQTFDTRKTPNRCDRRRPICLCILSTTQYLAKLGIKPASPDDPIYSTGPTVRFLPPRKPSVPISLEAEGSEDQEKPSALYLELKR